MTSFNEATNVHFPKIQKGAMYTISGGDVNAANKMYNKLNSGVEIILSMESIISAVEDDPTIPMHQFNFTSIIKITNMSDNMTFDIIGVVTFVGPSSTLRRRDHIEVSHHTI